jgi:hypothetical protein
MKFWKSRVSVCHFSAFLLLGLMLPAQRTSAQTVESQSSKSDIPHPSGNIALTHRDPAEDLNSLVADRTVLQASKPFIGEKDALPDFTRELLQVQWRPDDPMDLYVVRPKGVEKPPAVLYLYSYPADAERFLDDNFCRRVTRDGFAAIGFVSALTGNRYHNRPMKEWFVSELQESLVVSTHDVQMILDYLATRGDIDMDRIGMFGQGSGGSIAVLAAAADARIKAIDLLGPWGDWPDWMAQSARIPDAERGNYVKPEFLKRVAPFDPLAWLPKLQSRLIRIQYVADDVITPSICQKQVEAAAPRPSAQVVDYTDTKALLAASSQGKLFDWIKAQIRQAPDPRGAE